MTQTPQPPRDWQKDMERVKNFEYAREFCVNLPFPPAFDYDPTEFALKYWLQEVDKLQRGIKRWSQVAHETQTDLDASEAREQLLIHVYKKMLPYIPEESRKAFGFDTLLFTLYPDTPEHKEGEA
ncbi:hypothetical protein AMQ84_27110 [Paenibacillus riograndensis]|uniref:Uncharacterized protein n=1 Tax=Paenibacillus riograndensis TaxID=483937 RepID=A0A132TKL7_9BACL|nr:hypothetical protein [Paenibacillus riograndensis]KWX71596.1 hypothetical protein AMQ84_27110 [Paenibacillus riograndensis]